jgi:L-ascorbate 6-phosphate lactonase
MTETVHSDWGDWLPEEVAAATPDGVALWYLGCNGFVLKAADGTTLFIDPYLGTGDPPRTIRMIPVPFDPADVQAADAILATHEHVDHVHGPSQGPILASTGASLYGPDEAISVARDEEEWLHNYDISADQLEPVAEGDVFDVGSFTIHVKPAYDPDAKHPVAYIVEHDAGTFFHGGDSKPADAFSNIVEQFDIDLGILAYGTQGMMPHRETGDLVDTKWYNTESELLEAANDLRLNRLLPSHWDMWKRLTADPTSLHDDLRGYDYPEQLELLEIGDQTKI